MNDFVDPRTRLWAIAAVVLGIAMFLGIGMIEEPDTAALDLLPELVEIVPIAMTSVGVTSGAGPDGSQRRQSAPREVRQSSP